MKKLLTVILILALLVPFSAFADLPPLDGLTYDELVELKDQINLAIWNSDNWQEVTVPAGIWKIGEDIPEGHWSIRIGVDDQLAIVTYCHLLSLIQIPLTNSEKMLHMDGRAGLARFATKRIRMGPSNGPNIPKK